MLREPSILATWAPYWARPWWFVFLSILVLHKYVTFPNISTLFNEPRKRHISICLVRCVALLSELPTPHRTLITRLDWELPHLVSCCESYRVSFQTLELESEMHKKSKWSFFFLFLFFFFFNRPYQPTMLTIEPKMVSIFWAHCPISSTCEVWAIHT